MCDIRYERVVIMSEIKQLLGHHLEWIIMWELPSGADKIPVAAFKLRSDAEFFVDSSDLKDRMTIIYSGDITDE